MNAATPAEHRSGRTRFESLDGLRAIAVVAVFLFHGGFSSSWLGDLFSRVLVHLDTGVQVFFVLSGFLIYRPFAVAHLTAGPRPGLGSYAARRAARIFPAYWVALGILLALGWISMHGSPVAYFTLTQLYLSPANVFSGIAVAWSLSVEVSFYVLVPVWSWLVVRLGRRSPVGAELTGTLVLGAVGVAAIWWANVHSLPDWARVLPTSLATLGAGMTLAVVSAWGERDDRVAAVCRRLGSPAWAWWLAAGAVFSFQCFVYYGYLIADGVQIARDQLLRVPVATFLVVPGVFGAGGGIRRMLASRAFVYVGVVSYGIYLWHTPILEQVTDVDAIPPNFRVWVAFAATLAVASISWRYLEQPIIRAVHRARRAGARVA